jgi:hypothetical protein
MVNIYIQLKETAWIIKLSAEVKGKEKTKELKGIFQEKEEILTTLFSTLKTKENLFIITNDEEIQYLLEELDFSVKLEDLNFDFSEILDYKEKMDPTVPDFLEKGMKDVCIFDTKEQNQIAVGSHFVRAYMFFVNNPEKIKEIKLLKDLKNKGLYEKEILMEDILQSIEETMIN